MARCRYATPGYYLTFRLYVSLSHPEAAAIPRSLCIRFSRMEIDQLRRRDPR